MFKIATCNLWMLKKVEISKIEINLINAMFLLRKIISDLLAGHQQQRPSEILQQIRYTPWKHCQDFHI